MVINHLKHNHISFTHSTPYNLEKIELSQPKNCYSERGVHQTLILRLWWKYLHPKSTEILFIVVDYIDTEPTWFFKSPASRLFFQQPVKAKKKKAVKSCITDFLEELVRCGKRFNVMTSFRTQRNSLEIIVCRRGRPRPLPYPPRYQDIVSI